VVRQVRPGEQQVPLSPGEGLVEGAGLLAPQLRVQPQVRPGLLIQEGIGVLHDREEPLGEAQQRHGLEAGGTRMLEPADPHSIIACFPRLIQIGPLHRTDQVRQEARIIDLPLAKHLLTEDQRAQGLAQGSPGFQVAFAGKLVVKAQVRQDSLPARLPTRSGNGVPRSRRKPARSVRIDFVMTGRSTSRSGLRSRRSSSRLSSASRRAVMSIIPGFFPLLHGR
jgi:hypothetical protein